MNRQFSFKRLASLLLAVCLALTAALSLSACSGGLGDPLITLDGKEMTVNMYELLLSRAKANLAQGGAEVTKDAFWDTVIASDGTTYGDYVRQSALMDLKEYLAASVLFDELGLSLSDGTKEGIDNEIDSLKRNADSKSALNSTLAQYGANIDVLRAMYTFEAEYAAVRTQLYGAEGEKIAPNVLQEYLDKNAVCFLQILVRSYEYEYEKDLNGDEIYYIVDENNGKVSNIAYDSIHGSPRTDEFGKTIVDKNGEKIYYTDDGRISYDKEKGVRAYEYDQNGDPIMKSCSAEELVERRAAAQEILRTANAAGAAGFSALMEEYADSGDEFIVSDGYCFLYTTGDNGYDYLNDMADTLAELEVGEAAMLDSDYGCHIILRAAMPDDAASDEAYDEWFTDLVARVADELFAAKIAPYVERVSVDSEAFAAASSMKDIGINFYY